MPHPMDYAPQILTVKTSLITIAIWGQSDNCYQFKMFALLMYSRGVSPRNDVHMVFVYIASSSSANQQSVSRSANQCSANSLSHTPTDCINHRTCCAPFILTLTSRKTTSTALNHSLHLHATLTALSHLLHSHLTLTALSHSLQPRVIIHIQGKCTSSFNAY